jgi:signal transduction histidine kinase
MKNILLIEDDDKSVGEIASILKTGDYSLDVADNSMKGYHLALKNLPDLIICNKELYDNDISELLSRLRDESHISIIPFIFILDNKNVKGKRGDVSSGFDFYIRKPFKDTELLKIIELSLSKYNTLQKKSDQKMNELRGSISFSLPHEFFTPLNGILGFSEILMRDFDNLSRTEITEMLNYINKDAFRLKKLTENFLAFAQLEMIGKETEKVDALRKSYFINPGESVISSARQIAKDYARDEDLVLEIEDTFVRISESYLKKIISEIIDNAFKFSEKGTPVIASVMKNDTSVMISVSDNGRGMSPEHISSIGAYMQFDRKLHEQQGSGLGLIIAKKITELHGGDFMIESSLNDGTRINLLFDN